MNPHGQLCAHKMQQINPPQSKNINLILNSAKQLSTQALLYATRAHAHNIHMSAYGN